MVKTRAETRRDKEVRAVLACCRPGGENDTDNKELRDALQHIATDPDLKRDFELQSELDNRVVSFIENVELPPGLLARAEGHWQQARRGQFTWSGLLRHPAFWAALLAVNFLLAWGGWMVVAHMNGFTGDETVVKLIDFAWPAPPARGASAPKETSALPQGRGWLAIQGPNGVGMECGKLGDLLMLRHNIERYYVPPELVGYTALAYRVLEHGGQPAVEIMARAQPIGRTVAGDDSATDPTPAAASASPTPTPENIYFFSFRAEGRGVVIEPAGKWKFLVSEKGWTAAVQEHEGVCFVAATRGEGKEAIQRRLAEAKVQF